MIRLIYVEKIIRRLKNLKKQLHARIASIFYQQKTHPFSRQHTLQFQRPSEKNVWIEIPVINEDEIAQVLAGKITIFGHTTYINQKNPRWDHDLRLLPKENPSVADKFSFKIPIKESANQNENILGFDIKYPWERSRLQYLLPLGKAFNSNQSRSDIFDFFKQEIESWISHNRYLHGPNWMNAMEVGIRATTLIWLLSFFYTEETAKTYKNFWDSYLSRLLDHAKYIANYWEDYDYPNNHYLLNLTGAWYLARFFALHQQYPFGDLSKLWQIVCKGFNQQINQDGSHYESSTAYHKLVIQSLQHLDQLNSLSLYPLPKELKEKLNKGTQFLADSYCNATDQIIIGDDDSGNLVWPLRPSLIPNSTRQDKDNNPKVTVYPNFGIAFLINNDWHISLRTKSFQKNKPTGHAHADVLGVTVAYQGNIIITDPGTGCYTANTTIRNKLRSWSAHSTVWQPEETFFDFSKLFSMGTRYIPAIPPLISGSLQAPTVTAQYSTGKILFTRSIKLDSQTNTLLITDSACSNITQKNFALRSALTLNPDITVVKIGPTFYDLINPSQTILLRCRKTNFLEQVIPYSTSYGEVSTTKQIVAEEITPYHDCLEIQVKKCN